nr:MULTISPECIES: enoyl-CoA-hydratase DpgB [Frankia]
MLRIDGAQPLSAESVRRVAEVCDRVEDSGGTAALVAHVSGAPRGGVPEDLTVGLVTKWERALRRLERQSATTVAIASGDCGGTALDVLLATDVRLATPGTRLLVMTDGGATWPGMALYRLVQQVGTAAARRAVMFGAPIDAVEALRLGLLDELSDDPEGVPVEAFPGRELAIRRQLMFDASTTSFEEALGAHLAAYDRALRRGAAS